MSSLPGWKEISCFAAVSAGRFLCNQIAEMSTILYVCIEHGLGCALQSRVREGGGVSFGLITSLPTEQTSRLTGLGLHLVLKGKVFNFYQLHCKGRFKCPVSNGLLCFGIRYNG